METVVRASVKINEKGEVCFISAQNPRKRYYYNSSFLEQNDESRLLVMMYNPATEDAHDQTATYIAKVCEHNRYTAFTILNLIPHVGRKPENVDAVFDSDNFAIVERVFDSTSSPIWVGWGKTSVKRKEEVLFTKDLKSLLMRNGSRLIRAITPNGTYDSKYPVHPSYFLYTRIPPEVIQFVPFDISVLGV